MRHGTCFRRRLSARHAGAAPHSAVAELGVVRRLRTSRPSNERFRRHPESMPPTKLHALKTSSSRVYREFGALAFGSSESIEQPALPEFVIRAAAVSSTTSFRRVHREAGASRRSTRSSSERLDSVAVFGFLPLHAPGESSASRDSRSGVHRESGRCSRNSFRSSVLNRTSPNPALQRTAPRVTLAAAHHPAAFAHPAPAAFPQPARRAPQSLSLGSLGDSTPLEKQTP